MIKFFIILFKEICVCINYLVLLNNKFNKFKKINNVISNTDIQINVHMKGYNEWLINLLLFHPQKILKFINEDFYVKILHY